jgi:hypothetical protein
MLVSKHKIVLTGIAACRRFSTFHWIFARLKSLSVLVRGRGHNARDNPPEMGIVIDLTVLDHVRSDPQKRAVCVDGVQQGAVSTGNRSYKGSPHF